MRRKPRRGSSGQRGERGEAWRQSWKNSSLRPLRFSSVKSRLTIPYRARNISRPRKNSFRFRVPMQLSAKDAWKRILDEAHRELPDHTIRTWLEPTEAIALDEGRLIIGAPDQFAVEWNETKHATILSKLAAAAAHAAAESPGKTYNPLFIYGATGLGKTHLMQAIAHTVVERHPDTRVLYVGAEQFINEVIESIHSRTMPEFRRRYRTDVDLFLVDDVHFLEGKEMTQEEFFHTFNALYEGNKQIVLTSDRPPKELPGLEARLVSRFEWGMVADIGQPDLEHRIAILRKKQEQDHLEMTIPDDVLRFIAEHVRSNVRELEGCIIKLLLYASLKHKEVSIELAREALSDRIRPGEDGPAPRARPSINKVQEVVARRWGVTPEGLRSKARIKTLTVPRQIAMYLARELLEMQLVEIGQAFGGRDHSTVIHSVDKVSRQMSRDRGFRERVEHARQELCAE